MPSYCTLRDQVELTAVQETEVMWNMNMRSGGDRWWNVKQMFVLNNTADVWCTLILIDILFKSAKHMTANKYYISLWNFFLKLYFTIKLLWLLYTIVSVLWSYCYFAFSFFSIKHFPKYYALHFIMGTLKMILRNVITFS